MVFRFLHPYYVKSITSLVPDMKKIFIVSMLIAFAMICACQKQNSAAEQQLAQRKTELDTREAALDEREKALVERERAFAQREKAAANVRTIPPGVQGQTPDAAQIQAERDRRIQQLPPEFRALIPDRSKVDAAKVEKDRMTRERLAPRQLGPEDLQRQYQRNLDKAKMSGKAVFPAAEATSPTPSPAVEATSPSPSPTPE
ncbi:MAG: hypothetical protein DME95_02515 [Verrucomicrobia bacterium]|nr:MAG: hypothetical protein DME95_02515 [Verrucomicrobiota bacterium]